MMARRYSWLLAADDKVVDRLLVHPIGHVIGNLTNRQRPCCKLTRQQRWSCIELKQGPRRDLCSRERCG